MPWNCKMSIRNIIKIAIKVYKKYNIIAKWILWMPDHLIKRVRSSFKLGRQSILQNNALEQCHIRVKSRCLSSLNNSFFEKSAYHTKKVGEKAVTFIEFDIQ